MSILKKEMGKVKNKKTLETKNKQKHIESSKKNHFLSILFFTVRPQSAGLVRGDVFIRCAFFEDFLVKIIKIIVQLWTSYLIYCILFVEKQ